MRARRLQLMRRCPRRLRARARRPPRPLPLRRARAPRCRRRIRLPAPGDGAAGAAAARGPADAADGNRPARRPPRRRPPPRLDHRVRRPRGRRQDRDVPRTHRAGAPRRPRAPHIPAPIRAPRPSRRCSTAASAAPASSSSTRRAPSAPRASSSSSRWPSLRRPPPPPAVSAPRSLAVLACPRRGVLARACAYAPVIHSPALAPPRGLTRRRARARRQVPRPPPARVGGVCGVLAATRDVAAEGADQPGGDRLDRGAGKSAL